MDPSTITSEAVFKKIRFAERDVSKFEDPQKGTAKDTPEQLILATEPDTHIDGKFSIASKTAFFGGFR